MKLELITLTGPKMQEDVYKVILPTAMGDIAVLPGHMPLIVSAAPGVIAVFRHKHDSDDQAEHFATYGGVIEIGTHHVRVLVDEADHADQIHEETAQRALKDALTLKAQAKNKVELDKAQSLIDRQAFRLRVAELRRRRR